MSVGNWTTETYRLDEVTNRFNLPCVVCFSEGYMDATECESISKDDIIKIDKRLKLQKVAADFVNDPDDPCDPAEQKLPLDAEDPYVELRVGEILIPLNYGGTVKVLHVQHVCNDVFQLSKAHPRYAKVLTNINVYSEAGKQVTIHAGTRIELDRIIPGNRTAPDSLVIFLSQNGRDVAVKMPVTTKGKFKTLPDDTEYKMKEVIDRYGFPVVIKFIDDEIQRLYTMDIEEGISNMKHISATVRLKRLESQDAMIGHYKPLEGDPNQSKDFQYFARRSLVVLPMDNSEIREIQVHVLQDTDEEIYDDIFLVSNKSTEWNDVLDGTLYVDFSRKVGPRRLTGRQKKRNIKSKDQDKEEPPPRPPKTRQYYEVQKSLQSLTVTDSKRRQEDKRNDYTFVNTPNSGTPTLSVHYDGYVRPQPAHKPTNLHKKKRPKTPDPSPDGFEDYEEMSTQPYRPKVAAVSPLAEVKVPTKRRGAKPKQRTTDPPVIDEVYEEVSSKPPSDVSTGCNVADIDFSKYRDMEFKEGKTSSHLGDGWKYLKKKVIGVLAEKDLKDGHRGLAKGKHSTPSVSSEYPTEDFVDEAVEYDYPEPEELIAIRRGLQQKLKPVAQISPQSTGKTSHDKPFRDLTKIELEQRLVACGMPKFATVCRNRDLDGGFFDTISDKVLQKEPFLLDSFDLVKLGRIRGDWVPT